MNTDATRQRRGVPQLIGRRAALSLLVTGVGGLLAACSSPAPPPSATAAPAARPTSLAAVAAPTSGSVGQPTPAAGGTAVAAATAVPAGAPTAALAPKGGGELRVGVALNITSLEPHFNTSWLSSETTWLPYDRLIAYDQSAKAQPMLAESWEMSSDAKQIKFNLRKGVTWHTGRDFTSDDVKYTFTRILDPAVGNGQFTSQSKWFPSIETPDKYTVILKSDLPRPTMFDLFEYLNIVDKNTLEGPDAKTTSVGTGPYKFVEWNPGDHLTLAKNENYWQSGKPYLDSVRVNFFTDNPTMITQLEAGGLDMVTIPPRQDYVRLKQDAKFQGIEHPNGGSWYTVGINTTVPPYDNKLVRQALNFAIDRKRFVDTALLGVGTPQDMIWSPSSAAYEPQKLGKYPFDLDKAKSLLDQAGVSNLTSDILPLPGLPEGLDFCQIYQADLAKIGVKIAITPMDLPAWVDQVNNRKYKALYWSQLASPGLSPASIFLNGRWSNPLANNEGFDPPQWTQLINDANLESDPDKLKQMFSQLNDILLDECPVCPMSPNLYTKLAISTVHDVTPNMHNGWLYTDTWMA